MAASPRTPRPRRPMMGPRVAVLCVLLGPGCGQTRPAADGPGPKTVAVTRSAATLELFMEHPYLVAGEGAKLNVHLTVLKDGSPIRAGALTATATGPGGESASVVQAAPARPGIYGPVIAFPEAGENELRLSLAGEQATEVIRVPVRVYPDRASADGAADTDAGSEAAEDEASVPFLKEQAWKIGLVHEPAASRRLVERLVVPGEVVPAAGAKAFVTPPLSGRVLPPPGGVLPIIGQVVEAGQVVALIEPPLLGPGGTSMTANRAQVLALVAEADAKLGEAETELARAKISRDHAKTEYDRNKTLHAANSVSEKQSLETEREWRLARETEEGKLRGRDIYSRARDDLLSMLRPETETGGGGDESSLRTRSLPLRAPLHGVITAAQVTQGEFVDSTRSLYTIVDLGRVWIEAKVSESDLGKLVEASAADFTLTSHPGRRFSILGDSGGALIDVGKVIDPASRTFKVLYQRPNKDSLLRIGMSADVAIETAHAEAVLAVPESAIVDEDGRPTAYVQLDGEHYQKRDVELGLRDAGFVEVRRGIEPGERVVVRGAYAIRLASVSSVIPAHGHSH